MLSGPERGRTEVSALMVRVGAAQQRSPVQRLLPPQTAVAAAGVSVALLHVSLEVLVDSAVMDLKLAITTAYHGRVFLGVVASS